jgi:hypothetical protein
MLLISGWGGIRTPETLSSQHAFQACALNHSATHPGKQERATAAGRGGAFELETATSTTSGQGEIRTHDTVAGMPVFETGAFNHSATCPRNPSWP